MHALPPLPYDYNALEPVIDEQTMRIHHGKHHQTYVDNLNKALESSPDLQGIPVEQLLKDLNKRVPESVRTGVRNHGGGVWNHTFFWSILKKDSPGPSGELLAAIDRDLGGIDMFKAEFKKAALGRFGSGWAWLVVDKAGKLSIISTPNQDCPLTDGLHPLLVIDVWEHAYYLKYQNRRADFTDAFFSIINWEKVAEYYKAAIKAA
ncbi:TPA: superoxide dismutase [Candidatus Woesearchaeota archaeon]|nr:superoxide dismutase [Candidatus Woesearchaeota archaeon]